MESRKPDTVLVYSAAARKFHWWTVAIVALMFPVGFYMTYRGNVLNVWDSTTNNLYSLHKTAGFVVLLLTVARLVYRLRHGAPADEPGLAWWQRAAAHMTHWGLYGLLLAIPLLGWIGVSLYGARGLFFGVSLPPLAAVDQDKAALVFKAHEAAAKLMLLLLAAHIGAAIFHHLIRKDGVLRRMLPRK